jgi:acyl dehydratase
MMAEFFDDLTAGREWETGGRTVTEHDVLTFAGLSGDFNPLHVDAEFAKTGPFGARIAHGPCTYAIASGLITGLGIFDGSAIAFLELQWRFTAPVYIGDTITARMSVRDARLSKKGDRGVVTFDIQVLNQDGTVVQEGSWVELMAREIKQTAEVA